MNIRMALRSLALAVGALSISAGAYATITPEQAEQVKKKFESEFKGISVDEVSATPFSGILELRLGSDVLYTNAGVEFILQGSLVDVATRTDLTAERVEELNRVDFSSLPLDKAIKQVKGDGSQQLVIFEDPNCIYCKRLHESLEGIDNITVYSFLFPILTPDSRVKSEHVWCADDPAKAWTAWMKDNKKPAEKTCDTPIDEILSLGMKMGVQGTPAIVFEDGSRANGWLPTEQLKARLEQATKNTMNK